MKYLSLLFLSLAATVQAQEPVLVNGPAEKLPGGYQFVEGPIWTPKGDLLFSDIPGDTIFRLAAGAPTVYRNPSGQANGLALDPQGRVIACEHANRRVSRTESDGAVTVVADQYLGRKFNSPNDATVRSDGTVFFTDPPYGLAGREAELPFSGVYAVSPDGKVTLLTVYFRTPNGIALSPDERTLYVADSAEHFIQAFEIDPGKDGHGVALRNTRLLCRVQCPDGLETDERGQLWVAAEDGVRVYTPEGKLVATIPLPEQPANCVFGGEDGKTLFVTARKGVYRLSCTVAGAHRPLPSASPDPAPK